MAGSFDITTHDGHVAASWRLDNPGAGLHVPPGHWVDLVPVATGSVLAVLASETYDESDYIRDHQIFIAHAKASAI